MEIYNCTPTSLPVLVTHVPSGRSYGSKTIAPSKGAAWNTGRGPDFRVSINVIGPDKRFSRRNGGEVISIKNIAGNTELVRGRQCNDKVAQPAPNPSNGVDAKTIIAVGAAGLLLNELLKQQNR